MDIAQISQIFDGYGGLAIFLVVLLEYLNLPGFPAGVIMPLAGIYAAHGDVSLPVALGLSIMAGQIGCWCLYLAGRFGGSAVLSFYLSKFPKHRPILDRTLSLIRERGYVGLFFGLLTPVLRTLISIPAGMAKMPFVRYSVVCVLGVTVWNTVLLVLGYVLGHRIFEWLGV